MPKYPRLKLAEHAKRRMVERGISRSLIKRTIRKPYAVYDNTSVDGTHQYYGQYMPGKGSVRVVGRLYEDDNELLVTTVMWRNKLT